jgi:hypothetical protein
VPIDESAEAALRRAVATHDGFRVIARKDGARVRLYSRLGNDWTQHYPLMAEAVNHLKVRSCLIDGEVVCLRRARYYDFCLRTSFRCDPRSTIATANMPRHAPAALAAKSMN